MNVVSNTSPIIFLSKIKALDLLPQCFEHFSEKFIFAKVQIDNDPFFGNAPLKM